MTVTASNSAPNKRNAYFIDSSGKNVRGKTENQQIRLFFPFHLRSSYFSELPDLRGESK
ncbi:hypothetical protein [Vibrio vulnificus YJ016]|uniref:Uncharacterized protein n=1 Tax=Vibrio vulnificus (strain YJ016) TaxID=196600 RepID=Q7MGY5_VIBVY|nr:hypothetical protein [Vibrio vulnificus YJ016]